MYRSQIPATKGAGRAFVAGLDEVIDHLNTTSGWGIHSVAYLKSLEVTSHIWQQFHLLDPVADKLSIIIIESQLIRCATSVSANISEGTGRASKRQFLQFIKIARGSAFETYTFLTQMPPPFSTTILREAKEMCEALDGEMRVLIEKLGEDARQGKLDI